MNATRMAISELRRVTAGRLPRIAVIALVMIPVIYAGFYLYANSDPYSRLSNLPAALVVEDTGVHNADGSTTNVGNQVAHDIEESGSFQWHRVSADEAEAGVRDNRYGFALTLPPDFSSALNSSSAFTPRQGMLTLTTNDANNYLVHTIADQVVNRVRDSVAKEVGTRAADTLLTGFATIHEQTAKAADGATRLADGTGRARAGADQLATGTAQLGDGQHRLLDGAHQLDSGAGRLDAGAGALAAGAGSAATGAHQLADRSGQLAGGLDVLRDRTSDLPAQTRRLADGAQRVADGDARNAITIDQVAAASQKINDDLGNADGELASRLQALGFTDAQVQQAMGAFTAVRGPVTQTNHQVQTLDAQINRLTTGSRQVADGARQLADAAPALSGGIAQAADGGDRLHAGAGQLADGADRLHAGADELAAGTGQLHAGASRLLAGQQQGADGTDRLDSGAGQLRDGLGRIDTAAVRLRDGLTAGTGQIPNPDPATRAATAHTIGDPVATRNLAQSAAGSYGAGLAPFFLALSAWIGGYVLFLLLQPLSQRAMAANQRPLLVALGGWLPAAALGVLQMIPLYAVVVSLLGVSPAHPVATFGYLCLISLSFTAIVHALNATLGKVGQFVGLVLLVLQLASAGGTFPWQTIPDPLYPVHYLLPMSYAVDGLRHLLYGGTLGTLSLDAGVLVLWIAVAVLLAAVAARRQRVWTPSRVQPELAL